MAATLIFLKITDADGKLVTGESTAANYAEQIEVESFSWGVKADQSQKTGGATSSQVQYERVEIVKFYDRSTTALCKMMVASPGKEVRAVQFKSALVSFVDIMLAGKDKNDKTLGVPVLEVELTDGYLSEIKLAASESGKSMQVKETLTLSFRTIKMTYYTEPASRAFNRAVRKQAFTFQGNASSVDE